MSTKMELLSGGASISHSAQSPSFNAFSSENIADVAARVVRELNLPEGDPFDDDFYSAFDQNLEISDNNSNENDDQSNGVAEEEDDDHDEESEFEFAILNREENLSPISADEIFANGQIRPIYPIFNTDLVYGYKTAGQNDGKTAETTIRVPLRKLFEESNGSNGGVSCSSSEADELEGVPPGTYCVWTPKKKEEVMMRKKSKSTSTTGSSRRWRFMSLLHRSNSDGKDTFVFLTPSNGNQKSSLSSSGTTAVNGGNGKKMVRKGEEKRKSYLPYRKDLVGLFANVNGISRNVRPF